MRSCETQNIATYNNTYSVYPLFHDCNSFYGIFDKSYHFQEQFVARLPWVISVLTTLYKMPEHKRHFVTVPSLY